MLPLPPISLCDFTHALLKNQKVWKHPVLLEDKFEYFGVEQQLTSWMRHPLIQSIGYASKWHCELDMSFCTAGGPPRNNPTSIVLWNLYAWTAVSGSVLEKNKELIVDLEWSWWNW